MLCAYSVIFQVYRDGSPHPCPSTTACPLAAVQSGSVSGQLAFIVYTAAANIEQQIRVNTLTYSL